MALNDKIWNEVTSEIRQYMSTVSYSTWVEPKKLAQIDADNKRLIVKISNSFAADWLTSWYMPIFIKVLKNNRNLNGYCIEFISEDNSQTEQFSSNGFREKEINFSGIKTGYNCNVNINIYNFFPNNR